MCAAIGAPATIWAGDVAQGIYGFAGADPEWVYERIREKLPREVKLTRSYRSSPAVLKAVSAVAVKLGGQPLECAEPMAWDGEGWVRVRRFSNTQAESERVLELVRRWMDTDPGCTVAVMARSAWRRRDFDALVSSTETPCEIWDYPIHRPRVVQLLRKHLPTATARSSNDIGALQELYLLCFEDCGEGEYDIQDELSEAFDTLEELTSIESLAEIIGRIRTEADDLKPVSPGLHLLTGHVGKGQQFDHVVVLGLEDGILPDYRARDDASMREELAVLHVMVSRARKSLGVTFARDVRWDPNREWIRQPSAWLELIESVVT